MKMVVVEAFGVMAGVRLELNIGALWHIANMLVAGAGKTILA
jgi:hypothetical protein